MKDLKLKRLNILDLKRLKFLTKLAKITKTEIKHFKSM